MFSNSSRGCRIGWGHWNDCITAARRLAKVVGRRRELVDAGWSSKLLSVGTTYLESAERERQEIIACWPQLMRVVTRSAEALAVGIAEGAQARRPEEQFTP